MEIQLPPSGVALVVVLDLVALAAAAAALVTGSVGAYQALLVLLLSRPMIAFLFVLSSFEAAGDRRPPA